MSRKEKRKETKDQDRDGSDDITTDCTELLLSYSWESSFSNQQIKKKNIWQRVFPFLTSVGKVWGSLFGASIAFFYLLHCILNYLYMYLTPILDKELLQADAEQILENMKV